MPQDIPKIWERYDFYQLLGVPKDATDEVIRTAIKQKRIEWHPDRHRAQAPDVYDHFQDLTKGVNAANDVLLNPSLKARYNRFRSNYDPRSQSGNTGRGQGSTYRQREQEQRQRERREQEQRERKRQREYEREQQREREDQERRKREREAQHDRPPWERETNYTPSRNTPKTRPASAIAPNPAATVAYAILALLALAAAGALIYGFVQALPAIINFLKQLLIWAFAIAFLVGVIVAAAAASSSSRN